MGDENDLKREVSDDESVNHSGRTDATRRHHLKHLIEGRRSLIRQSILSLEDPEAGGLKDLDEDDETSKVAAEEGDLVVSQESNWKLLAKLTKKLAVARKAYSENEVEVRLNDVSYHIPLKIAQPTIDTWANQTWCYQSYNLIKKMMHSYKKHKEAGISFFSPFEKVAILKNINLIFKPSKSYLILGPPGCGKTTLLQVIAGLVPQEYSIRGEPLKSKPHLTGKVEYNGVDPKEEEKLILQNIVSYVEQLDFHAPRLTVKETFKFAFECRTGGEFGHEEIGKSTANNLKGKEFSENLTMEGLGLAHVADTFVGNADVRGVSGGQRRRVTVGEMMMGQNPVACADEISTGLDAASTYDMIRSMTFFAHAAGTTRIISLLQPGPETFALFDEVIILSEGLVLYAGSIDIVVEYFKDLGYVMPPLMDIADFLQAVSTPDGANFMDKSIRTEHLTPEGFATAWEKSSQGTETKNALNSTWPTKWVKHDGADENGSDVAGDRAKELPKKYKNAYQNSMWRSLMLNFKRLLTIWIRDKEKVIGKIGECVGMSAATGGILFGLGRIPSDYDCGGEEAIGQGWAVWNGIASGVIMAIIHLTQGSAAEVPDEVLGREIFYKHAGAKFFQTSSFMFGRLLSGIPQRIIEILSFGIPLYFLIGLDLTARSFFLYLAMLLMYTTCIKMFYSVLAMALPTYQTVQGVALFSATLMILTSGFVVYPVAIPDYYKFIMWINPCYWAFQGFLSIEYTSTKYEQYQCLSEEVTLGMFGFQMGDEWIGYSFLYLFGFTILCTVALILVANYVRFQVLKKKAKDIEDDEQGPKEFDIPCLEVNLTFENICYDVKSSTTNETLRLLNNVSGVMKAGRMCALMGSSGAGKTTLMDVISLRKQSGEISGKVELNGFPQEKASFLRISGYVEQFDVQAAELTVEETVLFSARLRLDPRSEDFKDDAAKQRFVEVVLEMLELTPLKKFQVGDLESKTGLSFEQRKRLAIAVELAASPSIIFLDEPTSGLDARAALVVMRSMKRIADTGRTVCATIHQPSAAVFDMFDDLLFLKKGGALTFFGDLGKDCSNLTNYFEDHGSKKIEYGENPSSWMLTASNIKEPEEWAQLYKESKEYKTMMEQIEAERESRDESKKLAVDSDFQTTFLRRLHLMSVRLTKIYKRSPTYNLNRMIFALLYAFFLGSTFFAYGYKNKVWEEAEARGLFGVLFELVTFTGMISVSTSIPVMKKIRDVFYKHRASGMIDAHSVAFSLAWAEVPYIVLFCVLCSLVFWFAVGIFENIGSYFTFLLFFALNIGTYTYFGQAFMCLVPNIATAMILVGAYVGTNNFFSGFIVTPSIAKNFIGTLGFVFAPGRYAYEGVILSLFQNLDNVQVESTPISEWGASMGCTNLGGPNCLGSFKEYSEFYFRGPEKYEGYVFIGGFGPQNFWYDLLMMLFYFSLAIIATHLSLAKLNYVNT